MGQITNPFGRRRNFAHAGSITDHLHREGVSYYPQSTIGDLTTQIIARFDERTGRGHEGTTVLTHMHDGMIAQVPLEHKDKNLEILAECGVLPFTVEGTELNIPVDLKWSDDSWAKC